MIWYIALELKRKYVNLLPLKGNWLGKPLLMSVKISILMMIVDYDIL